MSNKRISFNLVTAGASCRTAADLPPETSARPPTLKSWTSCPTSGSSRASAWQSAALSTSFFTTASFFFFCDTEVGEGCGYESRLIAVALPRRSSLRDSPPASAVLGESPWEPAHRKLFLVIPEHLGWAGLRGEREIKNSRGVAPLVVSPAAAGFCRHRRRMQWRGRFHQEEQLSSSTVRFLPHIISLKMYSFGRSNYYFL